jgi:hypothetical protein
LREEAATIVEDETRTIRPAHRHRGGRRSYLVVAPLAALVAVIAIAGALGPRPTPTKVPRASLLAQATAPATSLPSPSATIDPMAAFEGLDRRTVPMAQLRTHTMLPSQSTSDPAKVAVSGASVFVAAGGRVWRATMGADSVDPVASFGPEHEISQLAAVGDRLAVLEFDATPSACSSDCLTSYNVWLFHPDQQTGSKAWSFVEHGSSARLALGPKSWAISRSTPGDMYPSTIEIHEDSGRILWSTSAEYAVESLWLGSDSVLAGMADDANSSAVWIANAGGRQLERTGMAAAKITSTSSLGRYAAGEERPCVVAMEVDTPASGMGTFFCPVSGIAYSAPSIDGSIGAANMAWLASDPSSTHLVVHEPFIERNTIIENAIDPIWTLVQGSWVYWAEVHDGCLAIFEFDATMLPSSQD